MRKKLRLFASLCALPFVGIAYAQEDVTGKYIVNPSFELSAEETAFNETEKILSSASTELYGWVTPDFGSDQFANISVVSTNVAPTKSEFGATSPSAGSYYYFNRKGWGNVSVVLSQAEAVTLTSGRYYITVDYKAAENQNANGYKSTKLGFAIISATSGESIASKKTVVSAYNPGKNYFTNSGWKTFGIWFDIQGETEVKIALSQDLNGANGRADICLDNVKLYRWDLDEQKNYASASEENPLDVTDKFVTNPYFDENTNGWTSTSNAQNKGKASGQAGDFSGYFMENWNDKTAFSGKISQSVTGLPYGKYRISMAGFTNNVGTNSVSLFVGDLKEYLTTTTPTKAVFDTTVGLDGSLEFGIEAKDDVTSWIGIDNVRMEFLGYGDFSDDDKTVALAKLQELVHTAESLLQKHMYNEISDNLSEVKNLVSANLENEINVADYIKYSQALNENIASAESSVAYYESVNALLEKYSTIAESYNATDVYNEKVASIKTAYEEGTLEEKENIEADIRMIMQSSVASTVDNGDITGILVNPSFEEGSSAWSNGWTTHRGTTGNFDYHLNTTNPAEGSVSLNAWADQINYINVLQSVKLPEGIYTLTAQVRTNVTPLEEGTSVKAIVGDKEYNSNYMTYNLPDGVEWNGQEAWQTLKVTFIVPEEQTVTVGIYSKGNNRGSDHAGWFQVDNFRLYVENSYTRSTVTGNYGTICLPYAFELNDCEGIENIYKVSEMTTENAVISSVDAVEAGQPCIFKANADEITVKMPERSVVAEPVADDYLVGTFNNISKLDEGTYVLSGDKFYYVDSDVKADAFRCYFKPLSSGIKNFGFIGDGTVGINDVENDADIKDAVIYDLTGRRVKSPVKGIYIVNGKKMVINNLK